jgi:glycosyltransferase involved in cell wall biosynthesis
MARAFDRRPRVLILCTGSVGERMAGIAIRAVELARALRGVANVRIAAAEVTGDPGIDVPLLTWHRHDHRTVRPHLEGVDFVISQPQWPLVARELRRSGSRLIYDLSGPEPLETLETQRTRTMRRRRLMLAVTSDRLAGALHEGDHFLASTDRQVDLWLGVMLAERLLHPAFYDSDPALARRFALVPHGLTDDPPERSIGPGLRGAFDAIDDGDELILWNSAIWRWFDAATAIRAVAELASRRPSVKLVFMSRDANQPERVQPISAARSLAQELGVLGTHVLFNEGWVPYAERADWLLDADVALACHRPHLETRFSFRTRYLDCFWAGLPLVVTAGDELADRIARDDLGIAVSGVDPSATARALEQVLDRGRAAYADRIAAVADEYRWTRVVEPLREIVASPSPGPRSRSPRRPGTVFRDLSYRTARSVLNRIGIRDWPPQ